MYDENSFKNYIFWLKVKRVFLIVVLSVLGAFLGILISQFLIDVLLLFATDLKPIIITISTLVFFGISLLLTAGTGKEVQEGYWKMAVLRKLTVISKKLDYLENLDSNTLPEKKEIITDAFGEIKKEIQNFNEIDNISTIDNLEKSDKKIKNNNKSNTKITQKINTDSLKNIRKKSKKK